jgi:hypothetical protein
MNFYFIKTLIVVCIVIAFLLKYAEGQFGTTYLNLKIKFGHTFLRL